MSILESSHAPRFLMHDEGLMSESPTVTEMSCTKPALRSDVNTITSVLSAFCYSMLPCIQARMSLRHASTRRIASAQLKAGVVRESTSPWASPMVYVMKKDGTIGPCVDYRKLNENTLKDAYPLLRIDDSLDSFENAKYYSTLDLQSGYWQIAMVEKDKPKTAFVTRSGLYEYNTLPFGLCNAPLTFQRCMELIFRGMQWKIVLIYLDDIIIFSRTFETHLERINMVFKRLRSAGFKLKASKCELFRPEVSFLGHTISRFGIRPSPDKVKAVKY